jgi:hypothetical protein
VLSFAYNPTPMNAIKKLSLLIGIALFTSCSRPAETGQEIKDPETHDHTASPVHGEKHQAELAAVQLNNGEKWEANRETTEGIHRMEMLTNDFKGSGNAEEVQALKNQMQFEFNQILEQCTMTGEAHNQLHNYLIPLKGMIDKIDAGNVKEQERNFQEMQHYLELYGSFFS